jgi:hypothetical protein
MTKIPRKMVESGKKWVKNSDFSPSNHLKIGEKFIQNRQNSQKNPPQNLSKRRRRAGRGYPKR